MSRETPQLVSQALKSALKLVDSDADVSTIDLDLLANLNTNQSLNYIELEQQLNKLEKNTQKMAAMKEEFSLLVNSLDEIETYVSSIEEVADELNAWSHEVTKKV